MPGPRTSAIGSLIVAAVLNAPCAMHAAQAYQASRQAVVQADPAREQQLAGMIVRKGSQYLLRDSSGKSWKIDNRVKVRPYAGKSVTVGGRTDADGMTIHIDSIRPV